MKQAFVYVLGKFSFLKSKIFFFKSIEINKSNNNMKKQQNILQKSARGSFSGRQSRRANMGQQTCAVYMYVSVNLLLLKFLRSRRSYGRTDRRPWPVSASFSAINPDQENIQFKWLETHRSSLVGLHSLTVQSGLTTKSNQCVHFWVEYDIQI